MKDCVTKRHRKCRWSILPAALMLPILILMIQPLAHYGTAAAHRQEAVAMDSILEKEFLTRSDYRLVFLQTGLGRLGVDELRSAPGFKKSDILKFQKAYCGKWRTECIAISAVTKQDRIIWDRGMKTPMAPVQDGDVLLSFSSHTFGWRHGHAGLVVNADKGVCLEAAVPGRNSRFRKLEHWKNYSGFAILRLKGVSKNRRNAIACYAARKLWDVPYELTSGLFGKKAPAADDTLRAQCAYLIWYAFAHFGYDVDSDGGNLVTVNDLAKSPLFEVVQVFGIDPDKISCTGNYYSK